MGLGVDDTVGFTVGFAVGFIVGFGVALAVAVGESTADGLATIGVGEIKMTFMAPSSGTGDKEPFLEIIFPMTRTTMPMIPIIIPIASKVFFRSSITL